MTRLAHALAALVMLVVVWFVGGSRSPQGSERAPIAGMVVRHPWLTVAALAAAGLFVAAFLVLSGVVPIKASSGHWRITAALLDFAKTRSVATHSWGIQAPPLDDEALVLKGAGHYEGACAPCHGAPGRSLPPVTAAMTPHPPQLTTLVARWAPEELFTIVKHGIKFTGMPGWPAQQRDDEVWAMVAFLRRLPELDTAAYRRLTHGDPAGAVSSAEQAWGEPPPGAVRELCSRCHGASGTGRSAGAFPSLAGQRSEYVYASLRAYRDRTRFSGIMSDIAARLDDDAMRDIASYYERLQPLPPTVPGDDESIARGRTIATLGRPERDIPACVECHGPTAVPKNPAYPRLAGQHAAYLTSQLQLLQQRRRGGTENVNLMEVFVGRLRPEEIRDVTRYYASLPTSTAN